MPVPFGNEHHGFDIHEGEGTNRELYSAVETGSREDGINEQDISQEITKLRPEATPLDTITRELVKKRKKAVSQEIKYYQQSSKPFVDELDSTASGNGTSAASPAKNYTVSGDGVNRIFIQVVEPDIWRVKDTLLMRGLTVEKNASGTLIIGGGTNVSHDQMFYVASKSGAVLEIVPIGGMVGAAANANKYVVPTFDATTKLYRMGSAMAEKDMQTEAFGIAPVASVNFCQNFMAQVEESTFEKLTKKEVNYDFADQEADALYDMRNEIETSFLWGEKYFYDNSRDGRTYFCEGIIRQIGDRKLTYGTGSGDTTLTAAQYMTWLKTLFTGNSGSSERILLAGSGLIAAIELFQLSNVQKQLSATQPQETYLGVKCTKIVNTFGSLYIMRHPLFDEHGCTNCGLAIDPQYLYKHEFKPMSALALDFKTSGQKNVDAKILQEVSCLTLRYPECHAWIEPA